MMRRFTILAAGVCVANLLSGVSVLAQNTEPSEEAQSRRRPVRIWSVPPSSGNCVTFNFVRAGLKASYRTVSKDGTVTYTITYLSDNETQTKVTQKVQSPGPGGTITTDAETTMDWESIGVTGGSGRALKQFYVKTTTPIAGFTSITETTSQFVPSLLTGPKTWCADATFRVPPSTQTVTVKATPGGTSGSLVVTNESTIRIVSVAEQVTVPAGTFDTVRHEGVSIAGSVVSPATVWTSKQHSILVKQLTYNAQGELENTTELMSLQ